MAEVRPSRYFATRRSPVGSTLSARPGQHEIATVQATDIDHAAGIVSVTTTLAHSRPASGSLRIGRFARLTTWRAPGGWERRSPMPGAMLFSHWLALPAKTISMLLISTPPGRQKPEYKPRLNRRTRTNGGQKQFGRQNTDRDAQSIHSGNASLKSQLSTVLRDQLVGELKAVSSADAAAIQPHRILPAKNSLNIADARHVENAFQERLAEVEFGAQAIQGHKGSSFARIDDPTTSLERTGQETNGIFTFPIERSKKAVLPLLSRDKSAIESM